MVAQYPQVQVGKGAYTLAEAARFAKMRPQTMSRWFFGTDDAPLRPTYQATQQSPDARVLSFADLIQAVAVRTLRTSAVGKRVQMRTIRSVVSECEHRGFNYPLARNHMLYWFADRLIMKFGDEYIGLEPGIDKNQIYSGRIVEPFLQEVTFHNHIASTWTPLRWDKFAVVLDQARRFGMPFIEPGGILVSALVDAVLTEGSIEAAADAFEVDPAAVRLALKYEEYLSPAA